MRPSRRLGYRLDVGFDPQPAKLNLELSNHGNLGAHLQARSLTVSGAPYSYTIGAGDRLAPSLPNPGTYDLSLHGPNGFFRQFAGSPATTIRVDVQRRPRQRQAAAPDHRHQQARSQRLPLADGGQHRRRLWPGPADQAARHRRADVDTRRTGGWYDIALTTRSDPSFAYELAGRLESGHELTSDPQLGRAQHAGRREHSERRAKQVA